jgi:predicted transcriptional regulator
MAHPLPDQFKGGQLADLSLPRRDVLVSVRPIYASKILDGKKTVELRRKFPATAATGAVALIYSSSPISAIVGYAMIRAVHRLTVAQIWQRHGDSACISKQDFDTYFSGVRYGYRLPHLTRLNLTA